MHYSARNTAMVLLAASSAASPMASPQIQNANQPITDDQSAAIAALSKSRRDTSDSPVKNVNQPINPEQSAAIAALSLGKRGDIETRDSRQNCGLTILDTKSGGKQWVPVDQYLNATTQFCRDYATTDVFLAHETSDTYGVRLTNHKDPTAPGVQGNVVFAIFNTATTGSYIVNEIDCYNYMAKQSNSDSRCYGTTNHDTEGGYWKVSNIGVFGSEVYKA